MIIGAILSSLSPAKPQTQQERTNQAYSQYAGTRMAASGSYISNKSPLEKMTDDFLMDIGSKPKDADYYARLSDRQRRSQEAAASAGGGGGGYNAGPTPEEIAAAKKAEEQRKRAEAGQAARKEYEQKKGALVLAQRKKYTAMLNLA